MVKAKFIVLMGALALAACSSAPPKSIPSGSTPHEDVSEVSNPTEVTQPRDGRESVPSRSQAVVELLDQARLQYRYGKFSHAVRTAERGLRIERSESEWYLILAESYLKLGSPANAQQFARQGLRYSQPVGNHYQRLLEISDGNY